MSCDRKTKQNEQYGVKYDKKKTKSFENGLFGMTYLNYLNVCLQFIESCGAKSSFKWAKKIDGGQTVADVTCV